MPSRTVQIGSIAGLHLRSAARIAATAAAQPVQVSIRTAAHPPVPAHSTLAVLTLAAEHGTEVILDADGPGAAEALDALAALLAADLDAEPSDA